jgi:ubiquinone/menaquinone biosynthesis C-methylase UbiE
VGRVSEWCPLHKNSLIYAEHVTRYEAVRELVKGKVVLDIACGSGYGSQILSAAARQVVGVDIDPGTVKYAQKTYGGSNIEFKVGDGEKIPLEDDSVDVVITYETIEHVKDYKMFMREVSRVLKKDGLAIISTPNDTEFAEGNHFHLHEFKYKELLNLVKKHFKNVEPYFQGTWKYVALGRAEELEKTDFTSIPTTNYSPLNEDKYLYFFLLCSNRKIIEKVPAIAAVGEHFSDRYYIGREMTNEKNITEYKQVVEDLSKKIDVLTGENAVLSQRIGAIVSSRPYKIAQRVRKLGKGVNKRK